MPKMLLLMIIVSLFASTALANPCDVSKGEVFDPRLNDDEGACFHNEEDARIYWGIFGSPTAQDYLDFAARNEPAVESDSEGEAEPEDVEEESIPTLRDHGDQSVIIQDGEETVLEPTEEPTSPSGDEEDADTPPVEDEPDEDRRSVPADDRDPSGSDESSAALADTITEDEQSVEGSSEAARDGKIEVILVAPVREYPVKPKAAEPPPADRDGDTLIDEEDSCPEVAEDLDGFEDLDGCPDLDNDKDGIVDTEDDCPLEAEDTDINFRDSDGCPEDDYDEDGVLDDDDLCPKQPESMNGYLDDDGCPDTDVDPDRDGISVNNDDCPEEPETVNGFEDNDGCPDEVLVEEAVEEEPVLTLTPPAIVVNEEVTTADRREMEEARLAEGRAPIVREEQPDPRDAVADAVAAMPDDDGDGVPNAYPSGRHLDICPNTPINVTVDREGCPIDAHELNKAAKRAIRCNKKRDDDCDRVPDRRDQCPDTHVEDEVDRHGCSPMQYDSDGDGVPDPDDNCPETPGKAYYDGCPRRLGQ